MTSRTDVEKLVLVTQRCEDVQALKEALRSLIDMANASVEQQTLIVDASGVEALVLAMEAHRGEAEVQYSAAVVLSAMAHGQQRIVDAKGVEALVVAMQTHGDDPNVQRASIAAFLNIVGGSGLHAQRVVDAKGIEVLVAAIGANRDIVEIVEPAVFALGRLAQFEQEETSLRIVDAIVDANGVEAVVAAMADHQENLTMQKLAVELLRFLLIAKSYEEAEARRQKQRERLVDARGMEALVATMMAHTNDRSVQFNAVIVLWLMSCDVFDQEIIHANGIEALVAAMDAHRCDPALLYAAASAIYKIADRQVTVSRFRPSARLVDAKAVRALVDAKEAHVSDEKLQEAAANALARLGQLGIKETKRSSALSIASNSALARLVRCLPCVCG
eukprot:gnl/TRDRNA2_/TRDRNA2_92935_c0_seq2.p1 gnl/TRDRNA2_/TRDRNA2_92935_c0~~gnl/TRDRNA2_/TRDRNA2_92935_c0_seq2.p1  ORF type:complete len:389 (+),score=74.95 gnl/TRDRNA2_/TRDRNA2_92935_c0_seq2:147-1313(+)